MSVINTNVKSLVAQASLAANSKNQATAMERLSTGSRINSSKDDAAGLAISSRMTSQVRGLNMAIRNANDGISLAQTAEGALDETTSMLQRMRELSVQASNGVNNASDRAAIDSEVQQLKTEIDRIASTTKFNGQNVLDGSMNATLQIGDQVGQSMQLAVGNMATAGMGETASGLAAGATKAALTVSGVSTAVADYSGVSFAAEVNGVSKTVTLPTATPVNTAVATSFQGADRAVGIVAQQVGAFAERTIDISATANSGVAGKLLIAVNDGDTGTFEIDIATAAAGLGYNLAAMSGDQTVAATQAAINSSSYFTGDNAVTVSLDINDNLQFSVAGGAQKIAITEINNLSASFLDKVSGASTTLVATGVPLHAVTPGTTPLDSAEKFGMLEFSLVNGTNDTLSIKVGDGLSVGVDLASANTLFDTMSDLAGHIQTKLDATGAFTGDNAVTVSAVRDADFKWGLTFENATNQNLTLSGTFMTAVDTVGGKVNSSSAMLPSGTTSLVLTAEKQFGAIGEKTLNTTAVLADDGTTTIAESMQKFTLNVNNGGDVVVDFGLTLATMATTETLVEAALTQDQLVRAMQTAINATGNFQGDNAITVGVSDSGQVTLTAAGGVGSVVAKESGTSTAGAATTYDGLVKTLTGTNNGFVGTASEQVTSGGVLTFGAAFNANAANSPIKSPGSIELTMSAAPTALRNHFILEDTAGNITDVYALAHAATYAGVVTQFNAAVNQTDASVVTDTGKVGSLYVAEATTNGLVIKRKDGVDFTIKLGANSQVTQSFTADNAGATALKISGTGSSSAETVQTFGTPKTLLGAGSGGSVETVSSVLTGTFVAASTVTFDGFSHQVSAAGVGAVSGNANVVRDAFVLDFNANADSSWVASAGADNEIVMTASTVGNKLNTATYAVIAGTTSLTVGANTIVEGVDATYNLENTLTLKVGDNAAIDVAVATTDFSYSTLASLQSQVQSQIDSTSNLAGDNRVVVGVATDAVTGKSGLTFTQTSGQALQVSGSFITGELKETLLQPWTIQTQASGGIDLSADNSISVSIANADTGESVSKTITLGSSAANVSREDYSALVQAGINSAFSAEGYSVTSSSSNGTFSLALDQQGAKTITLSGSSVTAAVGGAQSATGASGSAMTTMGDVVAEINADLGGDAVASYDAATGSISFAVAGGDAGANSSVALSGAGLSAIQFGGALSASGSAGDATAARLSTITVDTIANASAAVNSIDNAIEYVNSQRSSLGAIQNRLDHTVNNLTNISLNTEASRSRIMDADYGQESAALAKAQIIQQAATAMLAQANQSSQSVLSLLQ